MESVGIALATALRREGAPDAACQQLQNTLQMLTVRPHPDTEFKTRYNLGNCALERGAYEPALEQFETAYAMSGGQAPQAAYNAAVALQKLGRLDESAAWAHRLVDEHPQLSTSWQMLGMAEATRGNFAVAAQAFEHALKIAPSDASAQRMLERANRMQRGVPR